LKSPLTLIGGIENGYIMADVVSYDDPVLEVVEKLFQSFRLLRSAPAYNFVG
jgi:hypothetical protein